MPQQKRRTKNSKAMNLAKNSEAVKQKAKKPKKAPKKKAPKRFA